MGNDQQRTRGRIATFDPNPRWPQGYFQVLEELGVEERRRPFYAHWVRQFFNRYPGRGRRELGQPEVEAFLETLSRQPGVADWQVAQARDALEVYYEQFRGIALDSGSGGPAVKGRMAGHEAGVSTPTDRSTGPIPAPREMEQAASVPRRGRPVAAAPSPTRGAGAVPGKAARPSTTSNAGGKGVQGVQAACVAGAQAGRKNSWPGFPVDDLAYRDRAPRQAVLE